MARKDAIGIEAANRVTKHAAAHKPRAIARKDRPVSVLAEQSMRPVEEVIRWCEEGKLRGYKSATGEWVVWGSQLDKWRQLLKDNPR